MKANKSFSTMKKKALKKGWAVPSNFRGREHLWFSYWLELEEIGIKKHNGIEVDYRPIPPVI